MMRLATALGIVLIASALAAATTITVVNIDGAGEGFNDPTPRAPVGGNVGTTLGAQRLNAFIAAADIWGGILSSTVEIRISANMDPLSCSSSSAVLGSAGPESYFKNFTGALLTDTYYPQALANKLAGVDVDPGTDDIGATFNSAIGTTCSFPMVWYYGLDASPPSGEIDFISVVLHELGHGLGFAPTVVPTGPDEGKKFFGIEDADDAYIVHLEDHSTTKAWPIMTNAERATSITDTGDLHWTGPAVVATAGFLAAGRDPVSGHVEMYAPSPVEPGSSIAHFSTSLVPDQLLEPFYTGPNHAPGLTAQVMVDMGWMLSCGDGVVDTGEGCDDGDSTPGDGCSALCQVEACWSCSGAPSTCSTLLDGSGCSDGNACTQTDSCSSGSCVGSNPVPCTALDQCHAVGVCNPSTGTCSNPNQPDGTACDDGEACTTSDECESGACAGAPTCIDDFLCYKEKQTTLFTPALDVGLVDTFDGSWTGDVTKPKRLCTPADDGGGLADAATHAGAYLIKAATTQPKHVPELDRRVTNNVGSVQPLHVNTVKPDFLLIPTAKNLTVDPSALSFGSHEVDHYKCYKMKVTPGTTKFPKGVQITLDDQFTTGPKTFDVKKPSHLCTPVDKDGSGIKHAAVHLLCYKVKPALLQPRHVPVAGVHVNNTFGPAQLDTVKEELACVPSLVE